MQLEERKNWPALNDDVVWPTQHHQNSKPHRKKTCNDTRNSFRGSIVTLISVLFDVCFLRGSCCFGLTRTSKIGSQISLMLQGSPLRSFSLYERPPKPPTCWNSHTRTLILDTIMKLSGTIGVTQKTMTFDTHVCLILLHTLNPQEQWGTHKKRWPFRPRPFADVIGLVRCSYIYINIRTKITLRPSSKTKLSKPCYW